MFKFPTSLYHCEKYGGGQAENQNPDHRFHTCQQLPLHAQGNIAIAELLLIEITDKLAQWQLTTDRVKDILMLSRLSMWVLNKLGWMVHADYPGVEKYVLIAAPHTSNWDFPLGLLAAWAIKLDVQWMGKHTLFRWPYGWFFRALGGIPVYREQGKHLSQQMAGLFARSERPVLALAPEGTRSKQNHWKTGFYYIARAANVPIVMGYLDYGHKQLGIGGVFYPGKDIEADFKLIRQFYKDRRGKFPEKESLIRTG